MKYIMFKQHVGAGVEPKMPVIFPDIMTHKEVAEGLKTAYPRLKIVSAGFYNLASGKCFGESMSLDVECDPTDEETIAQYQYWHGL